MARAISTGRSTNAAFTLVELLIVITLIGVLALVAIVRIDRRPEAWRSANLANILAIAQANDLCRATTGSYVTGPLDDARAEVLSLPRTPRVIETQKGAANWLFRISDAGEVVGATDDSGNPVGSLDTKTGTFSPD